MPSKAVFKFDREAPAKWEAALHELHRLFGEHEPDGLPQIVLQSAGRFVEAVANITPPASGVADDSARKAGELAIMADLYRLALPTRQAFSRKQARETFASAEELLAAHQRARTGVGDRISQRPRGQKIRVSQREFDRAVAVLEERVGFLAGALNAAADRLHVRLPPWIVRQGTKYGGIDVRFTATSLLVRIIQNVPYAAQVAGYAAKWAAAEQREIQSIQAEMGGARDKAYLRASKHLQADRRHGGG